ncbi:hypothetical protein GCM10012275_12190 [Longimycelium tulufanense]|uniref:Putative zinc-finger domain-containing protein n=1 Tax=Longimycelium tulufanense TaxID=907463 RepID=A0A8J3C6T4_9PSEU|nr:zf-HC2 domain-containing protein [Longimycelium tulufanense]GGM42822.1 hypothetical protein GCM10012275_12190 [Longimycelium tulufanense]
MNDLRGWALGAQHLAPDAVVAFVDGELSPMARDRAAAHLARCPLCAAEAAAQRQARAAVRGAPTPATPAGLLAALRDIPQHVDLPRSPDNLAVTEDGQLVAMLRSSGRSGDQGENKPIGSAPRIGSSAPLGNGPHVLGRRTGRRVRQGAGVVVSGLVLGTLALVNWGVQPPAAGSGQPEAPRVQPANAGPATARREETRVPAPSRPIPAPASAGAAADPADLGPRTHQDLTTPSYFPRAPLAPQLMPGGH